MSKILKQCVECGAVGGHLADCSTQHISKDEAFCPTHGWYSKKTGCGCR